MKGMSKVTHFDETVAFRRHPDQYPGTWWPIHSRAGEHVARVACHECGQVSQIASREKGDLCGVLSLKFMCRKTECGWTGIVRLLKWRG